MPGKILSDRPGLPQTLRERAEALLHAKRRDLAATPAKEVKALIYELNVHQMELEIQNQELREAQVELAHTRDRYANLYEFAPVGYVSLEKNGEIVEANLTAAKMLGVRRQELLGRNFLKFVLPPSQDELYLHRQAVFSSGVKQTCEIEMHKADGNLLSMRLESLAFGPAAEAPEQHCQTILIDITQQKQAERKLQRLMATLEQQVARRTKQLQAEQRFTDTVLDNLPVVSIVLDSEANIIRFNKACEIVSGHDFGELEEWTTLIPTQERGGFEQMLSLLRSGQAPLQYECHWLHKSGSLRLISWHNTVLKDAAGRVQTLICSGLDITAQHEAQQQAQRHMEEAARLQRILTTKELATVLAHEINQPLGAISMYADSSRILLTRTPLDQNGLAENLQKISEQALRGGEIIRGLLNLMKRKKIEPVALDLNAVLRSACELMQKKAEERNITINLNLEDPVLQVTGVAVYIEQVLLNLLRNAIDAIRDTHAGIGQISVESLRSNNMALVRVRDSGGGIDEETASRLFESFFSTKEYGLGVGLRISQSLIQAMGGRLWVEPHQPGAIFHFELPLVP